MPDLSTRERFLERVRQAAESQRLVKMTLSRYTGRDAELQNVYIRPVEIKDGPRLQFVYRSATQDVTKNMTTEEGLACLTALLESDFRNAHMFASDAVVTFEQRMGQAPLLRIDPAAPAAAPSLRHDREKQRPVDPVQARWLQGLGVTDARGAVCKGMEAKFRQIGKFVEVLTHLVADAGLAERSALRLVDMGCGKGYLTFAAYEWLRGHGWPNADVEGIEARPALVDLTNRVAAEHGLAGLHFRQGAIAEVETKRPDILVALHACDTATDDALARGVQAQAALILVAPCCHKELRPQLHPPAALAEALKHGILLERQAEFVTDALRAGLLEVAGYEARVFEFIATEHTAKNLMIAAVRRRRPHDVDAASHRVRDLAALYGIRNQRLADRLGFRLAESGG
jgi:SAM-dependent methyltransferase